jgi:hypothetical protein
MAGNSVKRRSGVGGLWISVQPVSRASVVYLAAETWIAF